MKKYIYTYLLLYLSHVICAQVPNKILYQSVVRNTKGQVLVNGQISFEISLHQGVSTAVPFYVERHTVTTNQDGLATLQIGNGNVISGNFQNINWNNTPIFLRSKVDIFGNSVFLLEGVTKLLSAPYSLYAGQVQYDSLINAPSLSDFAKPKDIKSVEANELRLLNNISAVSDYDGNKYDVVQIGTQFWLASNLRTTHLNDGTPIRIETADTNWQKLNRGPVYCWYNNDSLRFSKSGALYNFQSVNTNKLCPVGFHVPTRSEALLLISTVGGNNATARNRLVKVSAGGTNSAGFSADSSTVRRFGFFDSRNSTIIYLTSTDVGQFNNGVPTGQAVVYFISSTGLGSAGESPKNMGLSVRCIKD